MTYEKGKVHLPSTVIEERIVHYKSVDIYDNNIEAIVKLS